MYRRRSIRAIGASQLRSSAYVTGTTTTDREVHATASARTGHYAFPFAIFGLFEPLYAQARHVATSGLPNERWRTSNKKGLLRKPETPAKLEKA